VIQKQSIAISGTRAPVAATPLLPLPDMAVEAKRTQMLLAGYHQGECRLI
jgi:hypothetical protein